MGTPPTRTWFQINVRPKLLACGCTLVHPPRRFTPEEFPMRKAGFALALAASTQLTLLSSPAFAADASVSGSASVSIGGSGSSASASGSGTAAAAPAADTSQKDQDKIKTGWILVGVGGAVGIAGIIIDVVGANSGTVAGQGGAGDTANTDNTRTDLYFLGTTLIVAGVVTGVYGGSMVWSGNNPDKVKEDKPEKDEARIDNVTRVAQARFASAPSFVIPILGATF
jgi:hypothetical protein